MLSASGKSVHSWRNRLIAAVHKLVRKGPEDQIVVTGEDESCEELFELLAAFSSNKAALRMAAGAIKHNLRDAPMDAHSVWQKGETKGKGKERKGKDHWVQDSWRKGKDKSKDKGGKNVDKKSFVRCWVYNQFGHHCEDCPSGQLAVSVQLVGSSRGERKYGNSNKQGKGKGKGKDGKGKLGALEDQQHPQIAVQAPSWSTQHAQQEWHEGKQQHQPTGRERSHKVVVDCRTSRRFVAQP